MSELARPVLYMDFDGTLAFTGSVNAYPRRSGRLGYVRTNEEALPGQYARSLHWSGELVSELRRLPVDWLWLSTWDAAAVTHLDELLRVRSVGYLPSRVDDSAQSGKWEALLADQRLHPRPFVWCDDVATTLFDPAQLPHPVQHLVLTPAQEVGLTREDLARVQAFLRGLPG